MNHPADIAGGLTLPEIGKICAVAGQAQRDVRQWAARYPGVFPAKPFDPALFNTVCMCTAFSAPWLAVEELRVVNRAAIWGFGVDWVIDYIAASREAVRDSVERCLAVARSAAPGTDDLTCSLADIRDDLMTSPAFPALRHAWEGQLEFFLTAMAREWDWRAARAAGDAPYPTLSEYLDNTDNFGSAFVFVSHWIFTAIEQPPPADIDEIWTASRIWQRPMRLINDLGSYERDLAWGDLNALLLDITPEEAHRHIDDLRERFRKIVAPLRISHPRLARYMERQMAFCAGFYEVTDYWGGL